MARKRMIHPSIWENEPLGECSMMERLLFIGLFSLADDEGRGRANPRLVAKSIFPFDDIDYIEIEKGLQHLHDSGLIILYKWDEKQVYALPQWEKRQTQRNDRIIPSDIPEPPTSGRQMVDTSPPSDGQVTDIPPTSGRQMVDTSPRKGEGEGEVEDSTPLSACAREESVSRVGQRWQELFGVLGGNGLLELQELCEVYDETLILEAMVITQKRGKKTVSYAKGILRQWVREGIRTASDLQRMKEQQTDKGGKTRASPYGDYSPGRYKNDPVPENPFAEREGRRDTS